MTELPSESTWRLDLLGSHGHDASRVPATVEILAATAHELRLPLSHIKGFVSSLRRTDVHWDEATRHDFLAEIEVEADRLPNLVDALIQAGAANDTEAPTSMHVLTSAT